MPRKGGGGGKDGERGKKPNNLADMFNLQMPDDDEDSLLAELALLEGVTPTKSKKKAKPDKTMPLDQLLAQSNALINDEDIDDDEEMDDADLMAELGDILGESDGDEDLMAQIAESSPSPAAPTHAAQQNRAAVPARSRPAPAPPQTASSPLAQVTERREIYVAMVERSKAQGDTSKARRYERVLKQCDQALRTLKAGKPFDISTLPEPPPGFTVNKKPAPAANSQPAHPVTMVTPSQPPPQEENLIDLGEEEFSSPVPVEEKIHNAPPAPAPAQPMEVQVPTQESLPNIPKPGQLNVNVVDLLNHMEKYNEPEHKVDNVVVSMLKERGGRYRQVALTLHKQGRTDEAKEFLGISKQFESALNGYMLGDQVDLSLIPPDPTEYMAAKAAAAPATPPKATNPTPSAVPRPAPAGVLIADEQGTLVALDFRLDAYKRQQEKAQAAGNGSKARRMGRVIAQCEQMIKAVKLKKPADFGALPELPGADPIPLPPYMSGAAPGPRPAAAPQRGPAPQPPAPQRGPAPQPPAPQRGPAPQPPAQRSAPQAAPPAAQQPAAGGTDTLGELHKRMIFLTEAAEKAQAAGNNSKQRRMMRLIDQHGQIVKSVKLKKPIDMSSIPDIPGFEPVPLPSYMQPAQPAAAAASAARPAAAGAAPSAAPAPIPPSVSVKDQLKASTADKNMEILLSRQAEYKQQALKLYKEGDQVGAKKFLAQARGFDPMIDATKKGLPVDLHKIPPSLSSPPEKKVLSRQNTLPHMSGDVIDMGPITGDSEEMYAQLVGDLEHQIELCKNNAQTFQKLGDLGSAKHYAQQFQNQTKDLANLKGIYKQKKGLPAYRYEGCRFPILKCCPDLSDKEAEIVIVRCLNLPLPQGYKPDDLKIYCTWEFTIQEKTQKGQTKSYKGGINPDVFEQFRVDIGDRTARSFIRAIKRGNLKVIVYYERGFLKKPGEIGTATVKLTDWENLAEVHEAAPLLDGRKQTPSKVEVKVRIREPVGGAQCEFTDMKWLIVGKSRAPSNPQPSLAVPKARGRGSSPGRGASPNVRRR